MLSERLMLSSLNLVMSSVVEVVVYFFPLEERGGVADGKFFVVDLNGTFLDWNSRPVIFIRRVYDRRKPPRLKA